jgi:hypothetical protein
MNGRGDSIVTESRQVERPPAKLRSNHSSRGPNSDRAGATVYGENRKKQGGNDHNSLASAHLYFASSQLASVVILFLSKSALIHASWRV